MSAIKSISDVKARCSINERGCWIWQGALNKRGYANAFIGGKAGVRVHRWVLEQKLGKSIGDLCACHRCDVPACVNPDHLFAGTHKDNMRDASDKGRMSAKVDRHSAVLIVAARRSGATIKETARLFSVGTTTVKRVCRRFEEAAA